MKIEIWKTGEYFSVLLEYGEKYPPCIGSVGRGKTIPEALRGLAGEVEAVQKKYETKGGDDKPAATGSGK